MKVNNIVPTLGYAHSSKRILVVEDDDDIRRLNTEVLKRFGYEVDTAENGAAGWTGVAGNGYDLLITDHDMPIMSGVDLIKKLRVAGMTLPVILATGKLPAQELERSWPDQIAATLLKPYTIGELVRAVRKVMPLQTAEASR